MRLNSKEIAQDISQDVWVEVIDHLVNFIPRDDNSFMIWIYKIARNKMNDYYRKYYKTDEILVNLEEDQHIEDISDNTDITQFTLDFEKNEIK